MHYVKWTLLSKGNIKIQKKKKKRKENTLVQYWCSRQNNDKYFVESTLETDIRYTIVPTNIITLYLENVYYDFLNAMK